ncbi:hypothetical protein HGG78_18790 [Vibrio aestuarianus]|uniref:hypothetical protein n=1 Tax=Vibrio aestuarianus TaxID=28171 RepID=UPI0015598EC9|nr:hypothetical protein [Vibrio aestuarianus]NGZ15751.1 hypothetical protein [Vibrio aestuarianus]NKZ51899.1 hypothetical protein [Vibrio aestuarianus]
MNRDKYAAKTKHTLQQQTKLLHQKNSTSKISSELETINLLALATLCARKINNVPTLKPSEANKESCLFYGLS